MDFTHGPTARPHRNHGLFPDHYLDHTLPGRPDWWALADKARSAMEEIACVFESYAPSANGAQTEEELVKPVLCTLRQDFEVQPALATPDGTKRPDYVFYRDATSLGANKNRTLNEDTDLPHRSADVFPVGCAEYLCTKVPTCERSKPRRSPTRRTIAPEDLAPFEDAHRDG